LQVIKNKMAGNSCKPLYIPVSDNMVQDFVFCIQNMQTSYMGYLLQPLTFLTSSITNIVGNTVTEINSIRAMFNKVRTFISDIIQSVFGVFLNLVIEFQRITIGIKDLIGKTIGVMVTLMYMIDGSIKTMNATWNGPPGQMVQALGKCFHPNTLLKLQSGQYKQMRHMQLGDVLSDGSVVDAVLKIRNSEKHVFFKIPRKDSPVCIYVTGSHLIWDPRTETFQLVEKSSVAIPTKRRVPWFSCLITNTHRIPIDEYVFWDWEDHFVKPNLN
jgi:hypothetical protein